MTATILTPPAAVDVDRWALTIIHSAIVDHGDVLPTYGSPEWALLGAPQRWAAAVVAAENWRLVGPLLVARVRDAKHAEDAAWVAAGEQHAADYAWLTRPGAGPLGVDHTGTGDLLRAWLHRQGAA